MSFKEWFGYMKDEWEFHKRHPFLFIGWACYIYAIYITFKKAKP